MFFLVVRRLGCRHWPLVGRHDQGDDETDRECLYTKGKTWLSARQMMLPSIAAKRTERERSTFSWECNKESISIYDDSLVRIISFSRRRQYDEGEDPQIQPNNKVEKKEGEPRTSENVGDDVCSALSHYVLAISG